MEYLVAPERHEGEGFVLRSYDLGHGPLLSEAVNESHEHLKPWLPWARPHQSVEESERLVRQFRGRYLLAEDFVLGIFSSDEKRLLGGTGFHLREGPLSSGCAEIGMFIRQSEAGRGLGSRVLTSLLQWGFTEWPWLRLAWRCDQRNAASVRVAEKAGLRHEGVLRGQPAHVGDGRRDTACYALTRPEWLGRAQAAEDSVVNRPARSMSLDRTVRLVPLTDAEYADFAEHQVTEYATQLLRAGEVQSENAVATARENLADVFEDRLRPAGHQFLRAVSEATDATVGWIWLSPAPAFLGPGHERTRWLSQLTVSEPLRARGWGRAILMEAERSLVLAGVEQLWLRVFDWNTAARRLYDSLGYELVTQFPTDAHLRKRLRQTSGRP